MKKTATTSPTKVKNYPIGTIMLVKVTKEKVKDIMDRDRPKWWNDFIGETFECVAKKGFWILTDNGLNKLNTLRPDNHSHGAVIDYDCGEPATPTPAQEVTGVDDNRTKPANCYAVDTGQGKENCVFPACHCGLPAQEVHKTEVEKKCDETMLAYVNAGKQEEHKHTPEKVKVEKGHHIVDAEHDGLIIASCNLFRKDPEANAARIVECWNNYDKVKQDLYSIMNQAGMLTKIACDHEKEIENLKAENEQLKEQNRELLEALTELEDRFSLYTRSEMYDNNDRAAHDKARLTIQKAQTK